MNNTQKSVLAYLSHLVMIAIGLFLIKIVAWYLAGNVVFRQLHKIQGEPDAKHRIRSS